MHRVLSDLPRSQYEENPQGKAVSFFEEGEGWRELTWEKFWGQIQQTSIVLRKLGFRKGDRIAILLGVKPIWEVIHFAALHAGGVVVGIESRLSVLEIENQLIHSRTEFLVIQNPGFACRFSDSLRRRFKAVIYLDSENCREEGENSFGWGSLLRDAPVSKDSWLVSQADSGDLATIIYTSGTTGVSKGIAYTHGQILSAVKSIGDAFPHFKVGERVICWLPLSGLFQRMINLVAMDKKLEIGFVENSQEIMQFIREIRPALLIGVPRFYEKIQNLIEQQISLLDEARRMGVRQAMKTRLELTRLSQRGIQPSIWFQWKLSLYDRFFLRKIRAIFGGKIQSMITGSAPTSLCLLEFFHSIGMPLLEAYGLSENVVPMAMNTPEEFKLGTVGKPRPENEIRFAQDGEILVKGPGVMKVDLGEKGLDGNFTADGFLRTGDIGFLDEDGFLVLSGRKGDLIKTSTGRRISPVRIESVLNQSSLIDFSMVLGNGRKFLVALLGVNLNELQKRSSGRGDLEREIVKEELARINHGLSEFEQVVDFEILPELPSPENGLMTPNLKLKRGLIEEKYGHLLQRLS